MEYIDQMHLASLRYKHGIDGQLAKTNETVTHTIYIRAPHLVVQQQNELQLPLQEKHKHQFQ